jgi:HTH-type transcriptional regulator / antitoxin HigA
MPNTIREIGRMTHTIDRAKYIEILDKDRLVPKIIETQSEYEHFLSVAEKLIAKKQCRTIEETTLLQLLVKLIKDYEQKVYSLKEWSETSPHQMLQHLMEARDMKQQDLVGLISPSKGLISSIVNGKRQISKMQAKKLSEIFHVSADVFLS